MKVAEFDYELPPELIAQRPAAERTASRLLHLDGRTGEITDRSFAQFPDLVTPDDLLVVNDTRVIKARLTGKKSTGGKIELFVERVTAEREATALVRASHPPLPGTMLIIGNNIQVELLGRDGDLWRVRFPGKVLELLELHGATPLPPYITHPPTAEDAQRYQTVYAMKPGAVAAPTAGLHFDKAMLERLTAKGVGTAVVTLHVGAGTFQPVRTENVEDHRMHGERYEITRATLEAIARAKRVLAVGTTSLRALESATVKGTRAGETGLFITPGFKFRAVDRLLTNFHLPKSTLLMLACAFGGTENVLRAYRHAIEQRYRFFSYGDAMLIERAS
ncbi:MAG: tRNA preQ1(34) S-adenosylmethionine ribosyltransferase-isomerase QueA [Betaproteobacteria bacterium]|nr:tRNA preQ1(34) S-adenosylmethionine ribosyltransferase-isomerase QueA [Betaproteobacteria bacterium]